VLPLFHGAIQGNGKHLQITVIHSVDANLTKSLHRYQLGLDGIKVKGPQAFQGDAGHILRLVSAGCLFLDILRKGGAGISEGLVLRKFCLSRRDQLIPLPDIVDIANGEPASLFEERAKDLAIDPGAVPLETLSQQLRLQGIVATQGRITPGHHQIGLSGILGRLRNSGGDLLMGLCGLLHCHAPAVGEDIKHFFILVKAGVNAFRQPIGIDGNVMHGLHPGGIVI